LGGVWENRAEHLYLDPETIEAMKTRKDLSDVIESGSKGTDSRDKIDW